MAKRARERTHAIVVGTDFLAGSRLAQARAAEVALRHRAVVHVVHAAPRIPALLARRFKSIDEGKLREALGVVVDELREAGVDARAHLMHGEPVKCLTAKARALAADLVVVGTRGSSVLAAMIGSTAERLVAFERHRVLLVRRRADRPYRKVTIAANEDSRLREQLAAAAFVSVKPVTVLHACEAPFEAALRSHGASSGELSSYRTAARREAEVSMGKLLAKVGLEAAQLVLHHGTPFQVLERFDPESLMVLSRGRSRARQLLLGSATRAVVAYGRSDVLLV